ncbi:MAG TPA: carboxypeptidase-like regulatory domain-containing protein [Candidatus Limnocylindrales bacterium]|nr:carboxypeptidase-like regulatory domain-containing protein [Candidatus Limnocylindrales bacterium]
MRVRRSRWSFWIVALLGVLATATGSRAQQQSENQPAPQTKKEQAPSPTNRLTIEVTGGESNKPIENASVYVKTIEQHLMKDKKFEVNVKTNQNGVAHVPDAPLGKVKIQVVAEGWKPFGQWFDITDPRQVIKIHLERPPKWY